jgi:hypothetical protein
MSNTKTRRALLGLITLLALHAGTAAAGDTPKPGAPHTVIVTYRPKAGREKELVAILDRQFPLLRKHGLVRAAPHLVLTGTEEGRKPYLVEILTWRDHAAPDNVPTDVKALWSEMQENVESRLGRPGVDIAEVEIVASEPR